MEWGNIVSILQARRKREAIAPKEQWNPESIARQLCSDVTAVCGQQCRWVPMEKIVQETLLSEEDVIVGAVYGHVRGWLIYATHCVWLTKEGYAMVSDGTIANPH